MSYSTTDTYKMEREIMNYTKKFSGRLSVAEAKFNADMLYGMVASQSCLPTQISQRLQEDIKKRYTVDRLSDHLSKGIPKESQADYLRIVRSMTPSEPVIHIDDSDVVKPEGYHFESLGIVRDGSRSRPEKMCTVKDITLQKPVFSQVPTILSVFFQNCTPRRKKFYLYERYNICGNGTWKLVVQESDLCYYLRQGN